MSSNPEEGLAGAGRQRAANMVGTRAVGVALCVASVFLLRVAMEMPSPMAGDVISCLAAAVALGWVGAKLVKRSRTGKKG